MPATYTESAELRELFHFAPSAAYELLLSLGAVHWGPGRHAAWVEQARARLDADILEEVRFFYEDLGHPLVLLELPVDYPGGQDDAAGFIDYIADLDNDTFLFYLWGRVIPREDVPAARATPEGLVGRLYSFYEALWPGKGGHHIQGAGVTESVRAPEQLQQRLVALLRVYYDRIFRTLLPDVRPRWEASVAEKQALLAHQEPTAFLSRLGEGATLPPMFPPGTPLREVRLVPAYYTWRSICEVWGYGTVVILYDASLTAEREQELAQEAERLNEIYAALADTNRLKILRTISQDPEAYGHKLARLCGISQPAVSRHMGILKRAGLVDELPGDGRVMYRLRRATLENLPAELHRYLND